MKDISLRDQLYARRRETVDDFAFDEHVVPVFSDMIRRSVPGYEDVVRLTGWLAHHYAQPNSLIYDLGCSLGDTTLSVARSLGDYSARIIAIDNAPAMIASCKERIRSVHLDAKIDLICGDIREAVISDASVVILNYTMQFIAPYERLALLQNIYEGLRPGGVLIVSEKMVFEDPIEQARFTELHHDFKRANGYSDLEISQKRTALENVMVPDSLSVHAARFLEAGFSRSVVWHRCLNFASMIAEK